MDKADDRTIELTQSVHLEHRGKIALLIVDNPPVNVLSFHVRQGLLDGLRAAEASTANAIVLLCRGRTFIAGADVRETTEESMHKGPIVWTVQDEMENCPKPVIVAMHGTALGGGLEVALCAHYRVARPGTQFGLPEVTLGRVAGGGGTQRLPRITGVQKALHMLTSGERIDADEALACGLIDEIVDDLEEGAIAFAEGVLSEAKPLTRIRDRREKLDNIDPDIFREFRTSIAQQSRGFLAPEQNVKAVEAAVTLDFDAGIHRSRELAAELRDGPQQKAQQYYFFAERAAKKEPVLTDRYRDTIARRLLQQCKLAGKRLIAEGVSTAQLDQVLFEFGLPMAWLEHDDDATLVRKHSDIADIEILRCCFSPVVNEAAYILEQGLVARGSDIDVVAVSNLAWPVYTGGPVFWADNLGLSTICDTIEQQELMSTDDHKPLSSLLRCLADEGGLLSEYEVNT